MLYDSDAVSTWSAETASDDDTTISFTTHSPLEFTTINHHIPPSPSITQSTEIPLAASTQSELLNTKASHTPVHNIPEVTTSDWDTFSFVENTDSVRVGRDETLSNSISLSPENAQNLKSSSTDESMHSTNQKGIVSSSAFVTSAVTLEMSFFEDVTSTNGTNSTYLSAENGRSKADGESLVILQHFHPQFIFFHCCLLCLFALHVLFSFMQLCF